MNQILVVISKKTSSLFWL